MKKSFVIFSKRLERGTIIWFCICVFIIFLPRLEAYFFAPELSYEWSYQLQQKANRSFNENTGGQQVYKRSRFERLWKRCSPEVLSAADWQRLGLSSKQTSSLLRYRDKYGIHSLEQMRQIRVLPSALIEMIADSLIFTPAKVKQPNNKEWGNDHSPPFAAPNEKKIQKLDLNAATEGMLVALPGIGQYSAAKITAYRTRLGGFLSLEQLLEIKGLPPDLLENTQQYLEIKTDPIKIALNSITYEALKQHPYLTWNQANSIIKMRTQKGLFKNLNELKESVLIDEETYNKLLPYVSL